MDGIGKVLDETLDAVHLKRRSHDDEDIGLPADVATAYGSDFLA